MVEIGRARDGAGVTRSACADSLRMMQGGGLRPPKAQRGAALMALLTMVVLAGASVVLLQFNGAAQARLEDSIVDSHVLAEAKQALIAFAATYPDNYPGEGPGFLPCPDTDAPGASGSGSPNPPCGANAVGRLPYHTSAPDDTLGIGDLRDSSGERLWYAVAKSYRNNPKTVPLNSETPGELMLDGSGDIVALIFAPGPSFDGQPRNLDALDINNYLEGDNASTGDDSFQSSGTGAFNDRVVAITRRELMAAVEKRVLGEVAQALTRYQASYGAYPWLSPFADPKTSVLTGVADAGSSGKTLSDAGMDFVSLGVRQGDVLVNSTDGSRGVVDTVANGTLTLTSLRYGSSNAFAAGDDYRIGRYNAVVGVAQGQLPFHETDDPYKSQFSIEWNLQAANGISVTKPSGIGRYEDAAKRFVETSALSGALDVTLQDGLCQWNGVDSVDCAGSLSVAYFRGIASAGQDDELDDVTRNFKDWGVDKGAVVENLSDPGSVAIVEKVEKRDGCVPGPSDYLCKDGRLKFANDLAGGAVNAFQAGDSYRVRVPTQKTPRYTAGSGSSGDNLVDTNRDFVALGVQVGDTVENKDDNKWGRVTAVSATQLTVPGLAINPGEEYRVYYAFVDQREYRFSLRLDGKALAFYASAGDKRRAVCANDVKACTLTGTAKTGSSNLTLADAVDFSLVDTGDLIEIRSAIDGSVSRGLVKDVLGSSLTADYLSGGINQINPNDTYLIYLGESLDDEPTLPGVPAPAPDGLNDEQLTVSLFDRDTAGNLVGTAVASVPATGTASGTVLVVNLHVDLDVQESANDSAYDLPMWFTENDWHRLVYVAESDQTVPGADGVCDQGSDCLVVTGTAPQDNKRAIVIAAGEQLPGQDRVAGTTCGSQEPAFLCDYFENENADFDLDVSDPPPATFEAGPVTTAFNDKVRVVAP